MEELLQLEGVCRAHNSIRFIIVFHRLSCEGFRVQAELRERAEPTKKIAPKVLVGGLIQGF